MLPGALRRLIANGTSHGLSGMKKGNDVDSVAYEENVMEGESGTEEQINSIKKNGRIPIRKLSLSYFRAKLIRHFNIAFKREEVKWPRRLPDDIPEDRTTVK